MRTVLATASAVSLSFGCDTLQSLTAPNFEELKRRGVSWRAGYIDHVSPAELHDQIATGILFTPVTYALEVDPLHTIDRLSKLGIPAGATVWLDIERVTTALDPVTITTKCNTWARAVQRAGFEPGIYVGAGMPLNEDQLYFALAMTRYWHSASNVPKVTRRGYCMRQLRPPNVFATSGVKIDADVVEPDYLGGLPMFVGA